MLSLVQTGDPSLPPLVLIHDGGGTICSYYQLGGLDRNVYAIENPLLHSSRSWRGGIKAMAKAYSALIHAELSSRQIIIGGWSLGGLVALETVSTLTSIYRFDVLGVLLLDSVYPGSWKSSNDGVDPSLLTFADGFKTLDTKLLILKMMQHSIQMASAWQAPSWHRQRLSGGHDASCSDASDTDTDSDDNDSASVSSTDTSSSTPSLCTCCDMQLHSASEVRIESDESGPPVVLIRCSEQVPLPKSDGSKKTARVDSSRDCETLGWDHFRPGLVTKVLETNANHFNLFMPKQVAETTAKSAEALQLILAFQNEV